jgi:sulfite exporter TauE/SafE
MLASITPLGERSRGFSWRVTASWFALGAVFTGALTGVTLGAIGSLLPAGEGWRTLAVGAVLVAMVLFDATPAGVALSTSRRQVNEDWLGRYRGWVYGVGFGAQLGAGVVTVVTSAAIYAMLAVELLSASPVTGAAIGGAFGAVRAASLLLARGANDRDGLVTLHRRLTWVEPSVRRALLLPEVAALLIVLGWAA